MKFEFAPVSTVEVKHVPLMSELQVRLNHFFQSRNYGEDLKEVYIGVVVVNPKFERFFKQQKPIYTPVPKKYVRNSITYSVDRALKYYIKLNFERFNNASENEAMEMLKKELLNSIHLFDRLKNKIKDFNLTPFRRDMGLFLEQASA